MSEEETSRITKLKDMLYSRTRYRDPLDQRSSVKKLEPPEVEEQWQTPELDEILKHERTAPKVNPFMKKVFIFALLFFVGAIGVAIFVFLGGTNFVSSRNVDINVLGPTTVSAGEVFELGVSIANTNNAELELANLSIQYPQGSRNPDNTAESLTYTKDDLGVVGAGAETVRNVRMVLLGSMGEVKEIKFSIEYKVKGSNATFYKDKIFEITVGNAPITLAVASPRSTTSGDSFTTVVSVTLNSTDVLKNVILRAEYPYGYSVLDVTPAAMSDNNVWVLGDLSPGSDKTISIRGRLVGEDREERTFRFYVGVSDGDVTSPDLKVNIASLLNTVVVERSSIGLDILFNGESIPTYVAPAARSISTTLAFRNNSPDKLLNPRLELSLSGAALDKLSVAPGNNGVYDSVKSSVLWRLVNSAGNPELNPGEDGQVVLNFASLPAQSLSAGDMHDIKLNASLSGVSVGAIGQGSVVVSEARTVRISSQINLSSKILRSLGPFANEGPMPPKAGEPTTYTVVFGIGNTQGDLLDVQVTARLGLNVGWLGAQAFANEGISYDPPSNLVTWDVGELSSGAGFSSATRELAFQISLTPSIGQIGMVPSLVTDIVLSGRDAITGDAVSVNNPTLTTRLTSDPVFIQGDDIVVK